MTNATRYQCCICGNEIVVVAPDPVKLMMDLGDGEQQSLPSHYRCLKRALDPDFPLFPLLKQADRAEYPR